MIQVKMYLISVQISHFCGESGHEGLNFKDNSEPHFLKISCIFLVASKKNRDVLSNTHTHKHTQRETQSQKHTQKSMHNFEFEQMLLLYFC